MAQMTSVAQQTLGPNEQRNAEKERKSSPGAVHIYTLNAASYSYRPERIRTYIESLVSAKPRDECLLLFLNFVDLSDRGTKVRWLCELIPCWAKLFTHSYMVAEGVAVFHDGGPTLTKYLNISQSPPNDRPSTRDMHLGSVMCYAEISIPFLDEDGTDRIVGFAWLPEVTHRNGRAKTTVDDNIKATMDLVFDSVALWKAYDPAGSHVVGKMPLSKQSERRGASQARKMRMKLIEEDLDEWKSEDEARSSRKLSLTEATLSLQANLDGLLIVLSGAAPVESFWNYSRKVEFVRESLVGEDPISAPGAETVFGCRLTHVRRCWFCEFNYGVQRSLSVGHT